MKMVLGASIHLRAGLASPCQLVALSPCLLAVSLLGFAEKPDPEKWLREGHAAFARGDFAAAAALYERAEIYTTDPARVAYYLAGAKYQLALKTPGASPELLEADKLYRCCLDSSDPRRPRALFGLGDCLLHRAGQRDAARLRLALTCFEQCLREGGDDAELAADARHNREKVRLLLLQFQPLANGSSSEEPPRDDSLFPPRSDPRQPFPMSIGEQGPNGDVEPGTQSGAPKSEDGSAAAKSNDSPPPGKGNLEPIPDEVDVPPLSAHDAAEHLESANHKVRAERQIHHRRSERASASRVKDW